MPPDEVQCNIKSGMMKIKHEKVAQVFSLCFSPCPYHTQQQMDIKLCHARHLTIRPEWNDAGALWTGTTQEGTYRDGHNSPGYLST